MPTADRPRFKVVEAHTEDGIQYETLAPTRKGDQISDKVLGEVGRLLGLAGAGAGLVIGAVLDKMEARNKRTRRKSHISPF